MALLGILLLLLGAGVGVVAYLATHPATTVVPITALGLTRNATPFELVVYGALAMLLLALGWALLSAATRRRVRVRREEKERARVAEIEENAESTRREHEQRLQDSGLRDEDLRRRENELAARHEGLDTREAELSRREAELHERHQPAVAGGMTNGEDRADAPYDNERADRADTAYDNDRAEPTGSTVPDERTQRDSTV